MTAVIAAMLLCVKEALRWTIPNIELVTVLVVVSAYAFSPKVSVFATFVFCTGEWLIYGFGYWVVAYYIYWPLLAVASLSTKRIKKTALRCVLATLLAVAFTAAFGALTTAVDCVFMWGFSRGFATYFPIIYLRGLVPYPFYIVHVASSAATVGFLFFPLTKALARQGR